MHGPPFWLVTSALRWSYLVLNSDVKAQTLEYTGGPDIEMSRSDWIAQAGAIRGIAEQTLTREQLAYVRFFIGYCASDEDAQIVRVLAARALPERMLARLDTKQDGDDALTYLLARFAGKRISWRAILAKLNCRFEEAKDGYEQLAQELHAMRARIDQSLVEKLAAAGVVIQRDAD